MVGPLAAHHGRAASGGSDTRRCACMHLSALAPLDLSCLPQACLRVLVSVSLQSSSAVTKSGGGLQRSGRCLACRASCLGPGHSRHSSEVPKVSLERSLELLRRTVSPLEAAIPQVRANLLLPSAAAAAQQWHVAATVLMRLREQQCCEPLASSDGKHAAASGVKAATAAHASNADDDITWLELTLEACSDAGKLSLLYVMHASASDESRGLKRVCMPPGWRHSSPVGGQCCGVAEPWRHGRCAHCILLSAFSRSSGRRRSPHMTCSACRLDSTAQVLAHARTARVGSWTSMHHASGPAACSFLLSVWGHVRITTASCLVHADCAEFSRLTTQSSNADSPRVRTMQQRHLSGCPRGSSLGSHNLCASAQACHESAAGCPNSRTQATVVLQWQRNRPSM